MKHGMQNEMTSDVERRSVKQSRQKARRSRSIRREICLSEDEDATVRMLSKELNESFAGVIRALLFKAHYKKNAIFFEKPLMARRVIIRSAELDGLLVELKRIGVNINQCARSLNLLDKNTRKGESLGESDKKMQKQISADLRKISSQFEALNERANDFFLYAKEWGNNQESEYWNGYRDAQSGFGETEEPIDFFDESKQFYDEEESEVS